MAYYDAVSNICPALLHGSIEPRVTSVSGDVGIGLTPYMNFRSWPNAIVLLFGMGVIEHMRTSTRPTWNLLLLLRGYVSLLCV
jgi:hypothetical protein